MYEINEEKMFYDICDNRTIVINSETGIYYGINDFSTTIFENIVKGSSIPDMLAALHKIPGVPADIDQRLLKFIEELEEKEIIIAGPTVENGANINAEWAIQDDFNLSLIEFADEQELLLADPIEMIEYEGWQPNLEENK
jgi:hypothetical protein